MGLIKFAFRKAVQILKRFNIENRTYKFLEKGNLPSPPRHDSYVEPAVSLDPKLTDELTRKDDQLDKYLKDVYVKSSDKNPELQSKRPLPQKIWFFEGKPGFQGPTTAPPGYCTVSDALKFMSDHQGDPQLWSAASIAKEYKIDEDKIVNVLKYYTTFTVHMPKAKKSKTKTILERLTLDHISKPSVPEGILSERKTDEEFEKEWTGEVYIEKGEGYMEKGAEKFKPPKRSESFLQKIGLYRNKELSKPPELEPFKTNKKTEEELEKERMEEACVVEEKTEAKKVKSKA